MKRRAITFGYLLLLAALGAAYIRSAWIMPLRNYPFDFSINYTGARLLAESGWDAPLYDRLALAAEAAPYTTYPLYTKLFLTYIQTPLTAVILLPVAGQSLDDARLTVLIVSNALLLISTVLMVWALHPSRLLALAACGILGTYEAMFDSLRLGNVDALIVLLITLAFVALKRGKPWLIGAPLAGAAILKLSPAIIVGYFLWRRQWRVVASAIVGGAAVLALSVGVAGWQNHVTFVRETMPKLSNGSTFYDNVSLGGAMAREYFGRSSWYWEDQVWPWPLWLRATWIALAGGITLGGYMVARRDTEAGFMLATASAVLVAPIAWSFYPTWLIPSLLFLVSRWSRRRSWGRLALLAALYPLLAIVPAHFSDLSEELYRVPIKTIALALYCALLAWEAATAPDQVHIPAPARRLPVGAAS